MKLAREIEVLRAEARYRRERYDLLRAKAYGGRLVIPGRLAELERAAQGAEARLERAEARRRADTPATPPTPKGEPNGRS
jgi:hypothetical protein